MKINISDILKTDGLILKLDFTEKLEELDSFDDYIFDKPVEFRGELANTSRILKLSGMLRVGYKTKCYMCLKEIESIVDLPVSETIVDAESTQDSETYTYEGYYLSLDRILVDNIILSLPMKQVCKRECKGICLTCGKDLNSGACDCKTEEINPKFEILKNYFNNQE